MAVKANTNRTVPRLSLPALPRALPRTRAPALTRILELAIRFVLCCAVSNAQVLGGCYPFPLAMLAATGAGVDGLFTLLGGLCGLFLFAPFYTALRCASAMILLYAVAFALLDLPLYRACWFLPGMAVALCAVTGIITAAPTIGTAAGLSALLTELLLTGACAYLTHFALVRRKADKDEEKSVKEDLGGYLLLLTLCIALQEISLPGGLSLGRVCALTAALAGARAGGTGGGAAAGVTAGLAMDLAGNTIPCFTTIYGFAGLLAGALGRRGRILCAVGGGLGGGLCLLWAWSASPLPFRGYEVAAAALLSLLLPARLLPAAAPLARPQAAQDAAEAVRARAVRYLSSTAGAFSALHQRLHTAAAAPPAAADVTSAVFRRASDTVCRGCARREKCWIQEYSDTANALNDASVSMLERGKSTADDFPLHFRSRCLHYPDFLLAVNQALAIERTRQQYTARLRESRRSVCNQYEELTQVLEGAAAALAEDLTPKPALQRRVEKYLRDLGLRGTAAVYADKQGRLRAEIVSTGCAGLTAAETLEQFGRLLGVPVQVGEESAGRLVLTQAPPCAAVAGVAAVHKNGESVSGDDAAWFKTGDNVVYLLLCDGMGTGPAAREDSSFAVELLRCFLTSGIPAEHALKTMNAALALRGEEKIGFTTIDLLQLDLFTGEGAVYKYGAAPTYLKREGRISRITGSALPAGLTEGENPAPDVTTFRLKEGDCAVLLSDGISDGTEDGWVRDALAAFSDTSPSKLAAALVRGPNDAPAADDRTALVLLLKKRES